MIKGFADIVIADITAGQINHYFAEIAPRTVYQLYGNIEYNRIILMKCRQVSCAAVLLVLRS